MNRKLIFIFTVTLVCVLSSPALSKDEEQYFPLALSRQWSYEYSKTRTITAAGESSVAKRSGTVVDTVTGRSNEFQDSGSVFVVERQLVETASESGAKTSVQGELHYSVSDKGVLLYGQKMTGVAGHTADLIRFTPPQVVLKLPLETMPKEATAPVPGATMVSQPKPKSQSKDSVRVKAGEFEDCVKLEFEGPISGTLPNGYPIKSGSVVSQIAWYARGIGLVKTVETRRVEFQLPDGRVATSVEVKEQALVAYSKGQ